MRPKHIFFYTPDDCLWMVVAPPFLEEELLDLVHEAEVKIGRPSDRHLIRMTANYIWDSPPKGVTKFALHTSTPPKEALDALITLARSTRVDDLFN